jgi:hypothetical protein
MSIAVSTFLKHMQAHAEKAKPFMKLKNSTTRLSELFANKSFGYINENSDDKLTGYSRLESHEKRICKKENMVISHGFDSFLLDDYTNVKNVVFHKCDKNFTYYNTNPSTFPNLENLVITNHPCEPDVFNRFTKGHLKRTLKHWNINRESVKAEGDIYLSEHFYNYYINFRKWQTEHLVHCYDETDYTEWFESIRNNDDGDVFDI